MIRPIEDRDWDAVVALEASAYSADVAAEPREALRSRGLASPATCFVVDTGQRLTGYLLSLPYPLFGYPDLARPEDTPFDSPNLHLHDLVIAADSRRAGLGTRLFGHLRTTAESLRYERISLIAVSGSATFWAANGFRGHPEVALPTSYGPDALYMSRTI